MMGPSLQRLIAVLQVKFAEAARTIQAGPATSVLATISRVLQDSDFQKADLSQV